MLNKLCIIWYHANIIIVDLNSYLNKPFVRVWLFYEDFNV